MNSKKTSAVKDLTFADIIIGAMLTIVAGLMPIIVRFAFRPIPPELIPIRQDLVREYGSAIYPDVFSYWKGWFVLAPAAIIAFYCISDWATHGKMPDFKSFFKKPPVILSLVYLLFVIISAFASDYFHTSWIGTIERGEGAFMWLAYFVIFFAAMLYTREPRFVKPILFGLIFSSIIMGLIGVTQFMGRCFFDTRLADILVTTGTLADSVSSVFTIAHGTLYNPNTFGKYTAMLTPVLLMAALTYEGKRHVNILLLIAGALMLLGVFGSSSLGGLVGIVTAAGVLTGTYVCGLIYRWKSGATIAFMGLSAKWLAFAAGGIIMATAIAILVIPPLNSRVMHLFNRLGVAMRAETSATHNYIFEDDTLTIYRGQDRLVSFTVHGLGIRNWITAYDADGNVIPYALREEEILQGAPTQEGGQPQLIPRTTYSFNVPGYRDITLTKDPHLFLYHHRNGTIFVLTFDEGRIYGIYGLDGSIIDFAEEIPAWGFYGRETWGSNRGYIWSRTFPMMPSRILIGSGSDTYINVFPNHGIIANQRFFHNPHMIIDKAHNLFLQTWVTTGGISAIALFALFGHYLFTTFWSLVKSKGEQLFSYGLRLGLLTGISAFVMSSMATDSTIGSTGVFFVLLGVGYGINAWAAKSAPQAAR